MSQVARYGCESYNWAGKRDQTEQSPEHDASLRPGIVPEAKHGETHAAQEEYLHEIVAAKL